MPDNDSIMVKKNVSVGQLIYVVKVSWILLCSSLPKRNEVFIYLKRRTYFSETNNVLNLTNK